MKRAMVFTVLMLANMVLLVHSIVPHHHHESKICFSVFHCEDCEAHARHHECSGAHEHDNDLDGCLLKEELVILSFREESGIVPAEIQAFDLGIFFISTTDLSSSFLSGGLPFLHKPFLSPAARQVITHWHSLRAPPVC